VSITVVEPDRLRVNEETEHAAQRQLVRGDRVERDAALHVDDAAHGERVARDGRARRVPADQHAVHAARSFARPT
jgi:hypothetical protein